DATVHAVRKDNPYDVSKAAVDLLRGHDIISLVNLIYGLEDETPSALLAKLRQFYRLDPDILNAVYLTPHFWTAAGRATDPADVIQHDLSRWTYRNQIIATPRLAPWQLFAGVKLTEALFHLRPRALVRLVRGGDARRRQILRSSLAVGARVIVAEVAEFVLATRFAPRGSLGRLPGAPPAPPLAVGARSDERRTPNGRRAEPFSASDATTSPLTITPSVRTGERTPALVTSRR
ncbi:MAG: hypothetical protein HY329_07870, partial [Chloroflexi bacterium]|nr:hypothetical protein [Chloroflexota bacterium]